MRSAYTALAEGGADFLNEGPKGWKISAAGCREVRPSIPTNASWRAEMRAMYVVYLVLIATGILFYAAIGLMHN